MTYSGILALLQMVLTIPTSHNPFLPWLVKIFVNGQRGRMLHSTLCSRRSSKCSWHVFCLPETSVFFLSFPAFVDLGDDVMEMPESEVKRRARSSKPCARAHAKSSSGRPFPCHLCSMSFGQKCNLKRHVRSHTGERRFACVHCWGLFTEKSSLKRHLLLHSGEKPFRCHLCPMSFIQKGNLVKHMRTHARDLWSAIRNCSVETP